MRIENTRCIIMNQQSFSLNLHNYTNEFVYFIERQMEIAWDNIIIIFLPFFQIVNNALGADDSRAESHEIRTLTISPSEETLIASTLTNQLYAITLSSAEIGKVNIVEQA